MREARDFSRIRIEISDDCVGSAQCVALASEVFKLSDDGYATLIHTPLAEESIGRARDAEDVCPMGAIRVLPVEQPSVHREK